MFGRDRKYNYKKQKKTIYQRLVETANLQDLQKKIAKYETMLFEEKVAFAREIDEIIFKILSILAQ